MMRSRGCHSSSTGGKPAKPACSRMPSKAPNILRHISSWRKTKVWTNTAVGRAERAGLRERGRKHRVDQDEIRRLGGDDGLHLLLRPRAR